MPEPVVEKEICSKCGAEVREGTAFCYACGGRVTADEAPGSSNNGSLKELDDEAKAALDDLAQKMKGEQPVEQPATRLAKAAEERKKARVTQRKEREFIWEPRSDTPVVFLISAAVLVILAILVVIVKVVWN